LAEEPHWTEHDERHQKKQDSSMFSLRAKALLNLYNFIGVQARR